MSTTVVAALLAIAGVIAVAGVSWVFYLVGRAEDRDREAAERERRPPPEAPQEEHPERNGRLARERRRPMPPRRP
jgi:hypothetical protein